MGGDVIRCDVCAKLLDEDTLRVLAPDDVTLEFTHFYVLCQNCYNLAVKGELHEQRR